MFACIPQVLSEELNPIMGQVIEVCWFSQNLQQLSKRSGGSHNVLGQIAA